MNMRRSRHRFLKSAKLPAAFVLAFVLFSLTSCKKDHIFDFLKSTGEEVTVAREVTGNFTAIRMEDDVDLNIIQGDEYKIELQGGENILPGIVTEISDSTLAIRNENTYNWVRSYDRKLIANVTLPHLLKLDYLSTGTVTCADTIREDSLFIDARGGSGYINLIVKTKLSHMSIHTGSADMNISGISNVNFICANGYGPFHCQDLKTVYTYMSTLSTNDCYINVNYYLEYKIMNRGNIYYKGHPEQIYGAKKGSGNLIPLD
ncbi:MAG TPA: head GIN domain-containing protein [Bacteroidales bacterium]|nr:head GIN domain-containing protein [Bacteroidales bacterium]